LLKKKLSSRIVVSNCESGTSGGHSGVLSADCFDDRSQQPALYEQKVCAQSAKKPEWPFILSSLA
jgi:hypothetical protein